MISTCSLLTLFDYKEYEQTLETLAMLKMLAHSEKAIAEGDTVSVDDAFDMLRQRRGLK